MELDITTPSTSRIYDYMLGGHHNFEVDRLAAQQMLKVFPSYPRWARLNRWFLQFVAARWAGDAHRHILDLGSGMPTQGHFHTVTPDAIVIYTDFDPITVAYAREVIGENPAVSYLQADIRELSDVLNTADRLFSGERRIAIGCIGISYFIDDDALTDLAQQIHSWAAPSSVMALSFVAGETRTENNRQASDLFKRNGTPIHARNEEQIRRLLAPWQISEIRSLASWLNLEQMMLESDQEEAGAQMFGVLLEH